MRRGAMLLAVVLAVLPALGGAATPPDGAAWRLKAADSVSVAPPTHVLQEPPVELALNGPAALHVGRLSITMARQRPPGLTCTDYLLHAGLLLSFFTLLGMGRARREAAYGWILRR